MWLCSALRVRILVSLVCVFCLLLCGCAIVVRHVLLGLICAIIMCVFVVWHVMVDCVICETVVIMAWSRMRFLMSF